jgi:hypothetical protein
MALLHALADFTLAKVSIELIAIYFHSPKIFNIQIGEMAFCKPEFIIKSNYFQNVKKANACWMILWSRNVILKVVSSKHSFQN